MGEVKISVVVPIYNVQSYLERCIESIQNQTFKELEILLIDDGSTDQSGAIANYYAEKDSRIKVIHKKNGGLSDARNRGMQIATGEYIFFLDSDDWIALDTLEVLLDNIQSYDADIAVCGFYYAYDTSLWIDKRYWSTKQDRWLFNNEDAMKALIENTQIKNFAWGKLYKREMIQDIPFKKGVLFEDIFWQHQVFARSKRCIYIQEPKCYYYQRDNSIVGHFNIKKLDMLRGLKIRHQFIQRYYPQFVEASWYAISKAYLEYYVLLFLNRHTIRDHTYSRKIKIYINKHYATFKHCSTNDKALKFNLQLFHLHPSLMLMYRAVIKGMRRLGLRQEIQALTKVVEE